MQDAYVRHCRTRSARHSHSSTGQRKMRVADIHVLHGELEPAARLLAAAPGLGWSSGEHPGHLLLPLFMRLLGSEKKATATLMDHREPDFEELTELTSDEFSRHVR